MSDIDRGQVAQSAAEIYDEFFVPALFAEWSDRVCNAADITEGKSVLDGACGTGVLARAAQKRVGSTGSVMGLDINDGMLAVAREKSPEIDWQTGRAESLPFDDNQFDAVVSQFGLMFFEDREAALREMVRVLKPGGKMVVAVWGALDETPGYAAMVKLLLRLFGEEAANGIRAPYNLGDVNTLRALVSDAGINDCEIMTQMGAAQFPSLESWMYTDIKGWVLADMIDDDQFDMLLNEAKMELATFVAADGSVKFDAPAHLIVYTKGN